MAEQPSASEIHRAANRLSAELAQHGLLLAHDAVLPSATRVVSGVSIRGSWWAHPAGTLIYEALKRVEGEFFRVKLVAQKTTLVHHRLWPALVAVARSRQSFQTAALSADAQALLQRIDAERTVRVDQLPRTPRAASQEPKELAKQLELALLVFATTEHTEAGHHEKTLVSVAAWQERVGLGDDQLPELEAALEALTAPVRAWVGERVAGLLPWLPAAPRKSGRSRRKP